MCKGNPFLVFGFGAVTFVTVTASFVMQINFRNTFEDSNKLISSNFRNAKHPFKCNDWNRADKELK